MAKKAIPKVEPVEETLNDVAISFLAADEKIASAIAAGLGGLGVFFFPDRQEDLAGTDGLETMREPFLRSRVNVVLYREKWGKTRWTAVEEVAIKDRCFNGDWVALMLVMLDKDAPPPKWLPQPYVRFNLQDYGIDQLVGAVKARVQENGGTIQRRSAMAEAARVRSEAEYLADRNAMMRDGQWIGGVVKPAIRAMMEEVCRLAEKANKEHGFEIIYGQNGQSCVLRSGFVSLGIGWMQPIFNLVCDYGSDECFLRVAEFSGGILRPGERGIFFEKPKLIKETRFKVEVSRSRELVWVEGKKKEHINADQLADRIVQIFFDLVSRANQGKISRPGL